MNCQLEGLAAAEPSCQPESRTARGPGRRPISITGAHARAPMGMGVSSVASEGTTEASHAHAPPELPAMGISPCADHDAVASEQNGWMTHPPSPISGSPWLGAYATRQFGRFYLYFWPQTTWHGSKYVGGCSSRPHAPIVPHWNHTGLSTGLFAESVQYQNIYKPVQ